MRENTKRPHAGRSIFRLVFSLLCAMLLWLYVTGSEGNGYSQVFTGVSVAYDGESALRESRGLVITERYSNTVRFTLTGSRRTISRLRASDLAATVSLSDIYTTGYKDKAYTVTFPSGVDGASITVSNESPAVVSFVVDRLSSKQVPVTGVFNGSAADGYSAQALEFNPNTVTISGPSSSLEKIDHAWIEVNRENVDKTLTYQSDYLLMDADDEVLELDNITMETPTVEVTLPIISIKQVDLTVKILDGGGATSADCKIDIEPKSIILSGDSDTLAGTNSIDIATIDLSTVTDDSLTETYRIVIPNDTEIISGGQEATLKLEILGLETRQVEVSNFSYINATEGYSISFLQDSLTVTIRGEQEVLDAISDNNVRAVADLSEYGQVTGVLSVPAKIRIDGNTQAGAVGTYTVYMYVTDAESTAQSASSGSDIDATASPDTTAARSS